MPNNPAMKISHMYTYPIKSLCGVEVNSIPVTKHGFPYDRRFMLLKVVRDDNGTVTFKNMAVAHFYEMALFTQAIALPVDEEDSGSVTVTFYPPPGKGVKTSLDIPLRPELTDELETIRIEMHRSATQAYRMPAVYSDWFSTCFGYEVILAYLGSHLRKVLMTSRNNNNNAAKSSTKPPSSWLASLTSSAAALISSVGDDEDYITFADCAPYLIVSETSLHAIDARLTQDAKMDMRKFRPNIVIAGASEPWAEDFWGQLTFTSSSMSPPQLTILNCEQNCGRCQSINVDYQTGETATGDEGQVLKILAKDRRVDKGMKWNPIFGRYSFLHAGGGEGNVLSVGDEVVVSRMNTERTRFDWEGLCTK
ncbi:Hypothetical protein R9X50_00321100 [Acrodontium crateriforme]|uniref:MOSC domain-containing protein n=1 Tax=Acrodontium crateriforme TaxID=150365 RepID=A0AAQ3M300_9PEZI|nr:Hypothetical protein R9X50_00321100 [Acrodontium crateriforme]